MIGKYHPAHAAARAIRSLSLRARVIAIGAVVGATAVGGVAAAATGWASTRACDATGYCGTQADAQANPLYLSAAGKVAAIHAGTLILGQRPDKVTRAQDFWFDGLHGDLIHYAPYGHRSALCVAGHASGVVNLRPCHAAYATQSWTATPSTDPAHGDYFTIANGNGLVLTLHNAGQAASAAAGPVTTPTTRQEFIFAER